MMVASIMTVTDGLMKAFLGHTFGQRVLVDRVSKNDDKVHFCKHRARTLLHRGAPLDAESRQQATVEATLRCPSLQGADDARPHTQGGVPRSANEYLIKILIPVLCMTLVASFTICVVTATTMTVFDEAVNCKRAVNHPLGRDLLGCLHHHHGSQNVSRLSL